MSLFQRENDDRDRTRRDMKKTGRVRCIGCGRFVRFDAHWNQCPDCDTREAGER